MFGRAERAGMQVVRFSQVFDNTSNRDSASNDTTGEKVASGLF